MKIKSLLVLATSSIAFLASCSCSNNDQVFLNQINETLADHSEIVTCNDAVNVLKANNIDIFNYQLANNSREFVYDFDTKQFIVMENDSIVCAPSKYSENPNSFSYFKFTNVYNGNSRYSQYLLDEFPETENLTVTTGVDVGSHKDIKNVTYAGSVGVERNIKIRVYCDYLTIYADSDNVSYYGNANNIFAVDVKTFDIYGKNSYVQLRKGAVTFKDNSATDFLEIPTDYKDEVTVKQEAKASVACAINKPSSMSEETLPLTPVEVSTAADLDEIITTSNGKFIRLTSAIQLQSPLYVQDGKTFIIDLNGFAISGNNIHIGSNSSLYLIDSEYSYNENCGIFLSGNSKIIVFGYLLMNGGNVFASYSKDTVYEAIAVHGKFDMYGGQIIAENAGAITAYDSSTVNIFYGTIVSNEDVFVNYNGNLKIEAGKFTSLSSTCTILKGKLDISGGTFTAKNCIHADNFYGEEIEINISGGSFINDCTDLAYQYNSVIYVEDYDTSKFTINIDNAYLYSRCSYIITAVKGEDSQTLGVITINCNSGVYDYYQGNGVYVDESVAGKIKIKQEGSWVNHLYA